MLRSAHRQNLRYHKGQRLTAGCLCGGSKTFKRRILQASGAQAMANIAMYSPAIRKELPCKISTLMRRVRVWFHNATPNRGCHHTSHIHSGANSQSQTRRAQYTSCYILSSPRDLLRTRPKTIKNLDTGAVVVVNGQRVTSKQIRHRLLVSSLGEGLLSPHPPPSIHVLPHPSPSIHLAPSNAIDTEQARARRKDVEKLQRLLNRDKQSRKRTAARLTEKYEEAVRNLQMQHNRQTDEMQGTLQDLAAEFVTAHYYHAGYLQEQTAQHNDLRTRVTELENELRMTKQQVEGQARQLAARWNHHAPTNTLNTGASTSALLDAGNHMHGPPGAPHMHPAHMAYGQPSPAALHDHRDNVLGLLGPPRPHPVKDEFTAPFATPQLQRAAPHDHAGSAHTSYSYNPRDGLQANNVAVLGSEDTSVNVAGDGNIGSTASLWPPLTFDPAFSTRPRASPTRGLLNPPHNPVSPIYGPVKLDTSPEPVYTQLNQGGEWLPALQ